MRKLPVGYSDFKTIIERKMYYVDKSLFIQEVIDQDAAVLLIPRPRRFGKTLNLGMLRYFFEKSEQNCNHLFKHLKIWQAGEKYTALQGKFPVIYLTFKDVKDLVWKEALGKLRSIIQAEFLRHQYLREWEGLNAEEKVYYNKIVKLTASQNEYEQALKQLSIFLERYHGQKVVILLDEYDTPIQAGYVYAYYREMVGFMRNFLSGGFKDNLSLEKGVITGILRVAKESIFSGMNNLAVFSLLKPEFADKFGFVETEAKQMAADFGGQAAYEAIDKWYNGYHFGGHTIYNPWSLVSFFSSADKIFRPYWINTADNAVIDRFLTNGGEALREELETLMKGESLEKPVEENIIYKEVGTQEKLLWSFLLFCGYLKSLDCKTLADSEQVYCRLSIPNREVRKAYTDLIDRWFSQKMADRKLKIMLKAFTDGDVHLFERLLRELVMNVFSYHDPKNPALPEPEMFYHAFTTGLLVWLRGDYDIKSNRESGYGRYDLMVIPKDVSRIGYVIEFKTVDDYENETLEIATEKAFAQIEARQYAAELAERGVESIKKLAILFHGKQVWVKER